MNTTRDERHVVEKADVMIGTMVKTTANRLRQVAAGVCAIAALGSAGGLLLFAENAPVRLVGVTSEGNALVIEAS